MNPRAVVGVALWVVAVLAMATGWVILLTTHAVEDVDGGQSVFVTLAALSAPALCSAVLHRHPDEWTGPLVGSCLLAAILAASRGAPLGAMSEATGVLALTTVLLPAVVALDHPALRRPVARTGIVTWCWWVTVAVGAVIGSIALVGDQVPSSWWDTEDPGAPAPAATFLFTGWVVVVVFAAAATVVAAGSRYRSMPRGGRGALRALVIPLVAWAVATGFTAVWILIHSATDPSADLGEDPAASVVALLPALLVGALAAGIGWTDIMVRRPSVPSGGVAGAGHERAGRRETYVEQYLSRALADPSIRVLYPVQPTLNARVQGVDMVTTAGSGNRYPVRPVPSAWVEDWVDSHGRVVQADVTSPERAVTLIRRGGTLIGLIELDAAVAARPDAVELVATGAGLIMETEGLMATARGDLEQSRQLASRLLSASDQPRADLRAQLLAGPLDELAAARTDLAAGAPLAEIVPRLNGIAAQVRAISHGIFPTELTDRGLPAVLPGTEVPDRRYPAVIEMTAYLAALRRSATIADTTVDDEPAVLIDVDSPPSDTVRDRVAALGGHVDEVDTHWAITVPIGG